MAVAVSPGKVAVFKEVCQGFSSSAWEMTCPAGGSSWVELGVAPGAAQPWQDQAVPPKCRVVEQYPAGIKKAMAKIRDLQSSLIGSFYYLHFGCLFCPCTAENARKMSVLHCWPHASEMKK